MNVICHDLCAWLRVVTACLWRRVCAGVQFLYDSEGIGVTILHNFWVQVLVKHGHLLSEHDHTGVVKSALFILFLLNTQTVDNAR